MTVYDLDRDQLIELKQNLLCERYDKRGKSPSWGELADADDIISDAKVYKEYAGTEFSPDDFACSAGQDEDDDTCNVVIENANRHDLSYDLQYIANQIENGYTNGILSDGATWYIE